MSKGFVFSEETFSARLTYNENKYSIKKQGYLPNLFLNYTIASLSSCIIDLVFGLNLINISHFVLLFFVSNLIVYLRFYRNTRNKDKKIVNELSSLLEEKEPYLYSLMKPVLKQNLKQNNPYFKALIRDLKGIKEEVKEEINIEGLVEVKEFQKA